MIRNVRHKEVLQLIVLAISILISADFTTGVIAADDPEAAKAEMTHQDPDILEVKYITNTPNSSESYFLELIAAALNQTQTQFGPYRMDVRIEPLAANRKLQLLVEGQQVNIAWLPLDAEPSPRKKLIQIPIPIMRGLLGYRVALIRADNPNIMTGVNSVEDLSKLRLGQGQDWADIAIYKHNGLVVQEALNMHTLLRMLSGGRFDYLPLGVTETAHNFDLDINGQASFVLDEQLLIYYPFPVYFYVSEAAPELATRLSAGLRALIADGTFFQLFDAHFKAHLAELKLDKRRLIKLTHPYFQTSLDTVEQRLLFDPLARP